MSKGTVIAERHIGEQKKMNCGEILTITGIANRRSGSATYYTGQWPDGTASREFLYAEYTQGGIAKVQRIKNQSSHAGETRKMNCGYTLTITGVSQRKNYSNCYLTGVWEDSTESREFLYAHFVKGNVAKDYQPHVNHVGETKIMNCGETLTIFQSIGTVHSSKNSRYIGKWLSDGSMSRAFVYHEFINGSVRKPTPASEHINEARRMHCGLTLRITDLAPVQKRGPVYFIGEWEDGTPAKPFRYKQFEAETILYPTINKAGNGTFHGFTVNEAFEEDGETYYICNCQDCRLRDILLPSQMIEHEKSEQKEGAIMPSSRTCPHCGNVVKIDEKNCPHCGIENAHYKEYKPAKRHLIQ